MDTGAPSLEDLAELRSAIAVLQQRVTEQEREITALRQRLASGAPDDTPVRAAPSMDTSTEESAPSRGLPMSIRGATDRRNMLKKMGAVAAGVAMLGMIGGATGTKAANPPDPKTAYGGIGSPPPGTERSGQKDSGPTRQATGCNMLIGSSVNQPSAPTDTTALINPSTTTLMNVTFRADNYSNVTLPLPTARVAIVGLTSGPDTSSLTKVGVYGATDDANGYSIWGSGGSLRAVYGNTSNANGVGVYGLADGANAAGVRGLSANGLGGLFGSNRAQLMLTPQSTTGIPPGSHAKGEIILDSTGTLFLCVADGTPGTFRTLSGPAAAGALFLLSSPDRYVDTRSNLGGVTGPLPPNTTKTYQITGRPGQGGVTIPDSAVAVFGTLTAIAAANALPGSYLTAWGPGGSRRLRTSTTDRTTCSRRRS